MGYYKQHVFVCTNQKKAGKMCCANTGGTPFFDYLKEKLREKDLYGPDKIRVSQSGCLGRCELGACLVVYPEGLWYTYENFSDLDQIIEDYFLNKTVVSRLLIKQERI